MQRGELILRPLLAVAGRQPRYFRHPFLHTGRSLATKQAFAAFLAAHGYRTAPVSIDNAEWIFARAYMLARQVHDTSLADRLAARGYDFISLDEALEDPAYRSDDTYTGPGGITSIHRWAITRDIDPSMFRGDPATPDYMRELAGLPEHAY